MGCGEDGGNNICYLALGYGFHQTKAQLSQHPTYTNLLNEFAHRCSCTVPLMTRSLNVHLQLHGVCLVVQASKNGAAMFGGFLGERSSTRASM